MATLGISLLAEPSLKNLFKVPEDFRKFKAAAAEFQNICKSMLENRSREIAANPSKWEIDNSALTLLLKDKDTSGNLFFDEELAVATCAGFINGAYDTTHNTVFWAIWHLACHQGEQKIVAAEIDERFGVRAKDFKMEECRELKYLHAFLLESNRLRPTVPLGMRVNEEKDLTVSGLPVPQGITLMPNWSSGANSKHHFGDDVDLFRPSRFLSDTPEAKLARQSFVGFGSHARMCVGFKFAEVEMKCLLVSLVSRYRIQLEDGRGEKLGMKLESGVNSPNEKVGFRFLRRRSEDVKG